MTKMIDFKVAKLSPPTTVVGALPLFARLDNFDGTRCGFQATAPLVLHVYFIGLDCVGDSPLVEELQSTKRRTGFSVVSEAEIKAGKNALF